MSLLEGEREAIIKHVDEILKNYRNDRENLIPILQETQERLGYLPGLAMELISKEINVPAVDVFSLATFYNQFRLNPPGSIKSKCVWERRAIWLAGR